jgi:hypothetical protein
MENRDKAPPFLTSANLYITVSPFFNISYAWQRETSEIRKINIMLHEDIFNDKT